MDAERRFGLQQIVSLETSWATQRDVRKAAGDGGHDNLRVFTLRYLNINQVSAIDVINERLEATFYMELVAANGDRDPHLKARDEKSDTPHVVFPKDADGNPTYKPSFGWYMEQLDFNNAFEFVRVDTKIRKEGEDLIAGVRFKGAWTQRMNLQMYPFDHPRLDWYGTFVTSSGSCSTRCIQLGTED